MPPAQKPKRVAVACTLPPDLAARLNAEANNRMIHTSLLIERAVAAFLPTMPPLESGSSIVSDA